MTENASGPRLGDTKRDKDGQKGMGVEATDMPPIPTLSSLSRLSFGQFPSSHELSDILRLSAEEYAGYLNSNPIEALPSSAGLVGGDQHIVPSSQPAAVAAGFAAGQPPFSATVPNEQKKARVTVLPSLNISQASNFSSGTKSGLPAGYNFSTESNLSSSSSASSTSSHRSGRSNTSASHAGKDTVASSDAPMSGPGMPVASNHGHALALAEGDRTVPSLLQTGSSNTSNSNSNGNGSGMIGSGVGSNSNGGSNGGSSIHAANSGYGGTASSTGGSRDQSLMHGSLGLGTPTATPMTPFSATFTPFLAAVSRQHGSSGGMDLVNATLSGGFAGNTNGFANGGSSNNSSSGNSGGTLLANTGAGLDDVSNIAGSTGGMNALAAPANMFGLSPFSMMQIPGVMGYPFAPGTPAAANAGVPVNSSSSGGVKRSHADVEGGAGAADSDDGAPSTTSKKGRRGRRVTIARQQSAAAAPSPSQLSDDSGGKTRPRRASAVAALPLLKMAGRDGGSSDEESKDDDKAGSAEGGPKHDESVDDPAPETSEDEDDDRDAKPVVKRRKGRPVGSKNKESKGKAGSKSKKKRESASPSGQPLEPAGQPQTAFQDAAGAEAHPQHLLGAIQRKGSGHTYSGHSENESDYSAMSGASHQYSPGYHEQEVEASLKKLEQLESIDIDREIEEEFGDDIDRDQRKKLRNRKASKICRLKKKVYVQRLETVVDELTDKNIELSNKLKDSEAKVAIMTAEVVRLRSQLSVAGGVRPFLANAAGTGAAVNGGGMDPGAAYDKSALFGFAQLGVGGGSNNGNVGSGGPLGGFGGLDTSQHPSGKAMGDFGLQRPLRES